MVCSGGVADQHEVTGRVGEPPIAGFGVVDGCRIRVFRCRPEIGGADGTTAALRDRPRPVRLAERAHSRIVSWNEYDRGGHYATHDAPDLWLNDLWAFFAILATHPGSDRTTPGFRTPDRTTT
jgi:hypothetical protein